MTFTCAFIHSVADFNQSNLHMSNKTINLKEIHNQVCVCVCVCVCVSEYVKEFIINRQK